jgi:hypothetical protein
MKQTRTRKVTKNAEVAFMLTYTYVYLYVILERISSEIIGGTIFKPRNKSKKEELKSEIEIPPVTSKVRFSSCSGRRAGGGLKLD